MKTIQLDKYYQNVRGVQLKPGVQAVQDDLARYLVDNGHAVYADTIPQAVTDAPEVETATHDLLIQIDRETLIDMLVEQGHDADKVKFWNTDKLRETLESNLPE